MEKPQYIKIIENAHSGAVRALSFSPASNILLSGGDDSKVRSWDLQGRVIREYGDHLGKLLSVAYIPDQPNCFLSSASDGKLFIRNSETKQILSIFDSQKVFISNVKEKPDEILQSFSSLAPIPHKPLVAFILNGYGIFIWNWGVNQRYHLKGVIPGLGDVISTNRKRNLLATNGGKAIYLYDMNTGEQKEFMGDLPFALQGENGSLEIIDTNRLFGENNGSQGRYNDDVISLTFSDDGNWLFSGGNDGTLRWFNIEGPPRKEFKGKNSVKGHIYTVTGIVHVPSSDLIISCGQDGTLRTWNYQKAEQINCVNMNQPLLSMTISQDGQKLAVGFANGNIALINLH